MENNEQIEEKSRARTAANAVGNFFTNKATYYVAGGLFVALGGVISSFAGVGGLELAFAGAGLGALGGAVSLSAYSAAKMQETTNKTKNLKNEIQDKELTQPAKGHSHIPTYTNYALQALSAAGYLGGSVMGLTAGMLNEYGANDNEALALLHSSKIKQKRVLL